MATRVNDVLARWVRLPEIELGARAGCHRRSVRPGHGLPARAACLPLCSIARRGVSRIETIHAFSQWLLGAFPVEAGLVPGTRAMEDRDRDLLLREVLADLLVDGRGAGRRVRCLPRSRTSACAMGEDAVPAFLLRCAAAHDAVGRARRLAAAAAPANQPRCSGWTPEEDGWALPSCCGTSVFDVRSVRRCMACQPALGQRRQASMQPRS